MLIDNLNQIRYRIREASRRAHRDPDSVRLVAVTKYASLASVRALLASGLVGEVGESRVQDAEKKKLLLGDLAAKARWRLIGHLQTNKARKAARIFDAVDSVDSEKVAAALDASLTNTMILLPVMVQVKLTDSPTQSGVEPDRLETLLEALKRCPRLKVEGLMGIAPVAPRAEDSRAVFRRLRLLRDRHLPRGFLNMGMSGDFEVAVEEGADLVRIGTQIFSQPRQTSMEAPE